MRSKLKTCRQFRPKATKMALRPKYRTTAFRTNSKVPNLSGSPLKRSRGRRKAAKVYFFANRFSKFRFGIESNKLRKIKKEEKSSNPILEINFRTTKPFLQPKYLCESNKFSATLFDNCSNFPSSCGSNGRCTKRGIRPLISKDLRIGLRKEVAKLLRTKFVQICPKKLRPNFGRDTVKLFIIWTSQGENPNVLITEVVQI